MKLLKKSQSDEIGLNALINTSLEIRKEGWKKRKGGRVEEKEGWPSYAKASVGKKDESIDMIIK